LFSIGGAIQQMPAGFYLAVALSSFYHHQQISKLNLNDRENCKQFFQASTAYGMSIFAALAIGKLYQS